MAGKISNVYTANNLKCVIVYTLNKYTVNKQNVYTVQYTKNVLQNALFVIMAKGCWKELKQK